MSRAVATGLWLAAGIFVFSTMVAAGVNTWDEAWALQVAHRVAHGDVLYRDVFYGATPLWVYVAAGGVTVFGTHVLVLKAIQAGILVAMAVVGSAVYRRLVGRTSALLTGAILITPVALFSSQYTQLAVLLLMGTWLAVLRWKDTGGIRELVLAGGLAGLSFLAKQNVGILALAAAVLSVAWPAARVGRSGSALRDALAMGAAFIGTVGLGLVPVLLTGGWEGLLDYGFLSKGTYVRVTTGSYFDNFRVLLDGLATAHLRKTVAGTYLLIPPLTMVAVVVSAFRWRGSDAWLVVPFLAAAVLSLYPRAGVDVAISVGPLMLLGLAWAWNRRRVGARSLTGRLARLAVVGWIIVGLSALTLPALRGLAAGEVRASSLPRFSGVLLPVEVLRDSSSAADGLRAAVRSPAAFLLMPDAGFYYLMTGLANPTPLDYPLRSALGRSGVARVASDLRVGVIEEACVADFAPLDLGPQRPVELERAISQHLEPVGWTGACLLYRAA